MPAAREARAVRRAGCRTHGKLSGRARRSAALAEDDLYGAVESARACNGVAPRALATLAVARSVLEPKRAQQQRQAAR